jgi:hypothetical protein
MSVERIARGETPREPAAGTAALRSAGVHACRLWRGLGALECEMGA